MDTVTTAKVASPPLTVIIVYMTTPTAAPATPVKPPVGAHLGQMVLLFIFLILPPMMISVLIWNAAAQGAIIFGIIVGLTGVMLAGPKIGFALSFALVLLTPVAILAHQSPLAGCAFMLVVCLAVGLTARLGIQKAASMVALGLGYYVISPPLLDGRHTDFKSGSYLLANMGIQLLGTMWPAILVTLVLLKKKMHLPKAPPNSLADSVQYTIIFAVLVAGATYALLNNHPGKDAFWLILTLIVVIQAGPAASVKKTLFRAAGTVVGAAIAALIVNNIHNKEVIGILAFMCLFGALTFGGNQEKYWVYAIFLTMTIILMTGIAAPVAAANTQADDRIYYTVFGGALALIGMGLAGLIRRATGIGTDASKPPPAVPAG